MDARPLPARPNLEFYRKAAKDVVKRRRAGAADARRTIDAFHPRAARLTDQQFTLSDAQLVIAREHGFESWPKFSTHVEAVSRARSPVQQFEVAVDAIVEGDLPRLESLLRDRPALVRARSTRVHRATLLHYVSANGVEDYRQKSPANATQIAERLLASGADVDAVGDMYGGDSTTMLLTVSSVHPARAGVQVAIVDTLVDHGAALNGLKDDGSPLMTALSFGYPDAAEALVRRGARIPNIIAAAALDREDLVRDWLGADGRVKPGAPLSALRWPRLPADARVHAEWALIWAAMHGRTAIVRLLVDRGVSLGAKDDQDFTPLHWASWNQHLDTMEVLIRAKAPLETRNVYGGTVLDSTVYGAVHSAAPADYVPTLERLIAAGADLAAVDSVTGVDPIDRVLGRHNSL
jgi:hypothetical protein